MLQKLEKDVQLAPRGFKFDKFDLYIRNPVIDEMSFKVRLLPDDSATMAGSQACGTSNQIELESMGQQEPERQI